MEQWAEIRRMHLVEGLSINAIARRTGRDRKTVRRAIRSPEPPGYSRSPTASKLDPHREQIAALATERARTARLSMDEIAKHAGVTRTTLYNSLRRAKNQATKGRPGTRHSKSPKSRPSPTPLGGA